MSSMTKRALEESLKRLILQKPLTKITINDLTTDCGISRMAFYYHFRDIYDLVEWVCLGESTNALQGKKTYGQHGRKDFCRFSKQSTKTKLSL